ncbi:hypothetical protein [Mesorhizobium sp. WSM1497]|uniref:hypothetical protein n=1 Tax=Mesorhizobium sp. WSM1497 TaxID=278153 RepID=UPI001FDA332B|nr:hypothetical protein [Mesorhizobium sp. WSM1497]
MPLLVLRPTSSASTFWFGVLLGVSMQSNFMHPPFRFAIFCLSSVAALAPYFDRLIGSQIAPVTTCATSGHRE